VNTESEKGEQRMSKREKSVPKWWRQTKEGVTSSRFPRGRRMTKGSVLLRIEVGEWSNREGKKKDLQNPIGSQSEGSFVIPCNLLNEIVVTHPVGTGRGGRVGQGKSANNFRGVRRFQGEKEVKNVTPKQEGERTNLRGLSWS